jgi:putative FmdB family regulatory protein
MLRRAMPIYEYVCPNEHLTIDKRSIHDDNEPTKCAECDQPLIQKISGFGLSFKGSGFYGTDKNK